MADNLLTRGWTENTKCTLCSLKEKTIDHIFSQCVISTYLIANTQENFQLGEYVGDDVCVVWDRWAEINRTPSTSIGHFIALIAGWWITWDLRNTAILRTTQYDPTVDTYKIKQSTDLRMKLKPEWLFFFSIHFCLASCQGLTASAM